MLSKLGWSQGQTLGKSDSGLLDPIPIVSNAGKKGLGCDEPTASSTTSKAQQKRADLARKQQERYERSSANETSAKNMFDDHGDLDV